MTTEHKQRKLTEREMLLLSSVLYGLSAQPDWLGFECECTRLQAMQLHGTNDGKPWVEPAPPVEPEPFEPTGECFSTTLDALREIREVWAGAECGEPVYAQEAYAIRLCKQMYDLAVDALRKVDNRDNLAPGEPREVE